MSELIVSAQHSHAVELHQRIITSATLAQQNLWDMCTSLKEMRDGKLYKEFGYSNFEDYCEIEVGMKRRNAYNYISVIEKVNLKNVQPVAQIGIKKLALLATLSEEQQCEITEKVALEDTTYKELKAEIDKLKADRQATNDKVQQLESNAETLKNQRDGYSKQVDILKEKLSDTDEAIDTLKERLSDTSEDLENAQKYIKELESRPVEIAVQESNNDKELKAKIEMLETEKTRQIGEFETAIDKLTAEYEAKITFIQNSQNVAPSNEKEIFKVYFKVAYDSFNRLFEFAKDCKDKDFFKEKIGNLLKAFEENNAII